MEESWRMRMGLNLPRRKSTEETSSNRARRNFFGLNNSDSETLDPDDFNDVFGGPPRTILSRQFSGDFTEVNRSNSLFEEIFRSPDPIAPSHNGKILPVFRIPATGRGGRSGVFGGGEGFYDDIFGSEDDRRSRSRSKSKPNSKSNSSSVLSSEDMSPLRSSVADEVTFSSFASKLRPINVPCRWNSSSRMAEEHHRRQGMSAVPCTHPSYMEYQFTESAFNENFRSSNHGFSRRVPSPETISLDPSSYPSMKVSVDDLETDSPLSAVSSLCRDPETKTRVLKTNFQEEEEDEEVTSSYIIEISSEQRNGLEEAVAIDEAIAWAKEKFQTQSSEKSGNQQQNVRQYKREPLAGKEGKIKHEFLDQQTDGQGRTQLLKANEELGKWTVEEKQRSEKDMEMELCEEDIRLWSEGKQANIRLLLSTLHHILWTNSGWFEISLTSLIENSQVKKAYQKARLCLHPDKLQQRGATLPQKYVADKAFSILQDAWAAFVSQDVFFA